MDRQQKRRNLQLLEPAVLNPHKVPKLVLASTELHLCLLQSASLPWSRLHLVTFKLLTSAKSRTQNIMTEITAETIHWPWKSYKHMLPQVKKKSVCYESSSSIWEEYRGPTCLFREKGDTSYWKSQISPKGLSIQKITFSSSTGCRIQRTSPKQVPLIRESQGSAGGNGSFLCPLKISWHRPFQDHKKQKK